MEVDKFCEEGSEWGAGRSKSSIGREGRREAMLVSTACPLTRDCVPWAVKTGLVGLKRRRWHRETLWDVVGIYTYLQAHLLTYIEECRWNASAPFTAAAPPAYAHLVPEDPFFSKIVICSTSSAGPSISAEADPSCILTSSKLSVSSPYIGRILG